MYAIMIQQLEKKRRFKKRYLFILLLIIPPFFMDSCMRMRLTPEETAAYFKETGVPAQSKLLTLDGYELHYLESGKPNGHTLLLLHGSPGAWDAFKGYLSDPQLTKNFRLIAVDRPGFGYTHFGSSLNLDQQAEILVQLLKSLDNGKGVTTLGHSYGGPLAVAMALKEQNLIEQVVVIAGSLDPAAEKPELWRKPLMVFPLKYYLPTALKTSNEELWMLKEDLNSLASDLHKLEQHIYLIHGTRDRLVPYSNMEFMEKSFMNAQSVKTWSLPEKDHFILWEDHEQISDSVRIWLNSVKQVRPEHSTPQ